MFWRLVLVHQRLFLLDLRVLYNSKVAAVPYESDPLAAGAVARPTPRYRWSRACYGL